MEGGGNLTLTNVIDWKYDVGHAFTSLPIWKSHTFACLVFLFHVVYKKIASGQTESIAAHPHSPHIFVPQNALLLQSLWTAVRLLYMTTGISLCLPNVSIVIILSYLFSVVYRFPMLYLYTFFRCDKLAVSLLAPDQGGFR
jgi:hypothetical protein